jgi:hypothetical protein
MPTKRANGGWAKLHKLASYKDTSQQASAAAAAQNGSAALSDDALPSASIILLIALQPWLVTARPRSP